MHFIDFIMYLIVLLSIFIREMKNNIINHIKEFAPQSTLNLILLSL